MLHSIMSDSTQSGGRAERAAMIYAKRSDGFSLRAIAREFNLSVEAVRETAKRMERKAKWLKYAVQINKADIISP